MKFKEILRDALGENSRKGNFVRIYPAKGAEMYDKYFAGPRPYNRFLQKCLYSDEIIPMDIISEVVESTPPVAKESKIS